VLGESAFLWVISTRLIHERITAPYFALKLTVEFPQHQGSAEQHDGVNLLGLKISAGEAEKPEA
jgi:hypothetical protein